MSTTQACDRGHVPAAAPSDPAQQPPDNIGPRWQRPLKGLPPYPSRQQIKGSDRQRYRRAVGKAYSYGGSIRDISGVIGRSFGCVKRLLDEEGVELRRRGRNNRGRPGPRTVAEIALRTRIKDGTYELSTTIPSIRSLAKQFRMSQSSVAGAVARLETAGLLLVVHRRGIVVMDPENWPERPTVRVRTRPGWWETWTIPQPDAAATTRIRSVITDRTSDGTYAADHKIPSRAELAEEFAVSYATVHQALRPLEEHQVLINGLGGTHEGLLVHPQGLDGSSLKATR